MAATSIVMPCCTAERSPLPPAHWLAGSSATPETAARTRGVPQIDELAECWIQMTTEDPTVQDCAALLAVGAHEEADQQAFCDEAADDYDRAQRHDGGTLLMEWSPT
jgi:hypothetical protein